MGFLRRWKEKMALDHVMQGGTHPRAIAQLNPLDAAAIASAEASLEEWDSPENELRHLKRELQEAEAYWEERGVPEDPEVRARRDQHFIDLKREIAELVERDNSE